MARIGRNAINRARTRQKIVGRYGKKFLEKRMYATFSSLIRNKSMVVKSNPQDVPRAEKSKLGVGPFTYRGVIITPDASLSVNRRAEIRAAMLNASQTHESG